MAGKNVCPYETCKTTETPWAYHVSCHTDGNTGRKISSASVIWMTIVISAVRGSICKHKIWRITKGFVSYLGIALIGTLGREKRKYLFKFKHHS
jgi:hypothetical protein